MGILEMENEKYWLNCVGNVAIKEDTLFFVPANYTYICSYEMTSHEIRVIKPLPWGECGYTDCYYYNGNIWCISSANGKIAKYSDNHTMEVLTPDEFILNYLKTFIDEDGKLWIIPRTSEKKIISFDTTSLEFGFIDFPSLDQTQYEFVDVTMSHMNIILSIKNSKKYLELIYPFDQFRIKQINCDGYIRSLSFCENKKYFITLGNGKYHLYVGEEDVLCEKMIPEMDTNNYLRVLASKFLFLINGEHIYIYNDKFELKEIVEVDSHYVSGSLYKDFVMFENVYMFFPWNAKVIVIVNGNNMHVDNYDFGISWKHWMESREYVYEGEIDLDIFISSVNS